MNDRELMSKARGCRECGATWTTDDPPHVCKAIRQLVPHHGGGYVLCSGVQFQDENGDVCEESTPGARKQRVNWTLRIAYAGLDADSKWRPVVLDDGEYKFATEAFGFREIVSDEPEVKE